MADKFATEVTQTLRGLGVLYRADVTSRYAVDGNPGRPDYQCTYPRMTGGTKSFFIEVKTGAANGFNWDRWTEKQRSYPSMFGISSITWYSLFVGVSVRHKEFPRKHYLIPHNEWHRVFNLTYPIQKTLPYKLTKHHALKMREYGYSIEKLFSSFELEWLGGGTYKKNGYGPWAIPESHLFHRLVIWPDEPIQLVGKGRYHDYFNSTS